MGRPYVSGDMNHRLPPCPMLFSALAALALLAACAPTSTPTPFRPPTQSGPTQILPTTTPVPVLFTPAPTSTVPFTPASPCTDDLTFIEDLTIPDGTVVTPGSIIDKQWLVNNSGSCNWDARYRLEWIGGETLGDATEIALYPARAGTQVTLRIQFTVPAGAGTYESAWQAYGPDGVAFGDPIYVEILVQ